MCTNEVTLNDSLIKLCYLLVPNIFANKIQQTKMKKKKKAHDSRLLLQNSGSSTVQFTLYYIPSNEQSRHRLLRLSEQTFMIRTLHTQNVNSNMCSESQQTHLYHMHERGFGFRVIFLFSFVLVSLSLPFCLFNKLTALFECVMNISNSLYIDFYACIIPVSITYIICKTQINMYTCSR